MSEDVSSKVKKIVADHLGIDEAKVTEESSFIDDLGADSLDTVELVMAFEEEFGSEISDSEAEKILTVGDAVKFIEKINEKLDGLDIIVNNAGINLDNLSIRLTEDNWKKVLDINLTSTFLMCKYGIKKMLRKKYGKIINITYIVGNTGNIGQANYAASKAGIVAFSKSLALENAKKNINVNCVSPGFIKTNMTDQISEEFKKDLISKIPSGNLGTGEDVSNCVAFLASDMANYINGETIHVNGGMYMA